MKIIIIGAGIAGLSSYLLLHKHLVHEHLEGHTITIYEAYDIRHMKYDAPKGEEEDISDSALFTPKIIGNAIGLGKNGLAVLGRMGQDGRVLKEIQARGNCISKWRMGTARGWKIVDANVQGSTTESDPDQAQIANTVMIARQVAWEVLRDEVVRTDPEAVTKKTITKVERLDNGQVRVLFTDGTTDSADLLVGADGLRSIIRQTMFEDNQDTHSQTWLERLTRRTPKRKDYVTPHYEGLTGLGGFVPSEVLKQTGYDQGAMAITFGPNGFFGHGYIGPVSQDSNDDDQLLAAWWSTFSSTTPHPYQGNQDVAANGKSGIKTAFDKDRALHDLLERHKNWSDPAIQAILRYLGEHKTIEHMYPTYTTPELPTWKQSNNMVLVGDAAHALQPSSGQGACQALEDAEALALFLKHYLSHTKPPKAFDSSTGTAQSMQTNAIGQALSKYVDFRKPRIAKIYKQSQKMSKSKMDMNIVQEYLMYFAIWVATKLQLFKKFNDELFEYDLPAEVERFVKL